MKELEFQELKELKDIYLAKKQGEALERVTRPDVLMEGLGLGYYGPQTVLALGALMLWEDILNDLTGSQDQTIHAFVKAIDVASGARSAKRMEKSLETIGMLGQYYPMPSMQGLPRPERLEAIKPG